MPEIEPDADASIQELRSERPVRMAVLPIPAGTTRRALRSVCMRIHDLEGVLTVEVDRHASIRVTGTMDLAALVAVAGATNCEVA